MALRAVADHPKLSRLKSLLKCGRGEAMGYLEALWHFTGRFTPQGNIGKYSDAEIEAWIEWGGEEGMLMAALTESGWIDTDEMSRAIIHDWHEHADDFVHTDLARKLLTFSGGNIPNSGRLNQHERIRFKKWLSSLGVQNKPLGRPSKTQPKSSQNAAEKPKPEPAPEPAPEPGASTQAPPVPTRSQTPAARPGSNGEFMAATWLLQELGIASHASDIAVIAQVIAFEARNRGKPMEDTAEWILQETCRARERGEHITVFWLKDRKFALEGSNVGSGKTKPSAAKERVDGNRRAIAEALARRGVQGPWSTPRTDGAPIPESGLEPDIGRVHDGPRTAGPEILPPRSGGRYRPIAH